METIHSNCDNPKRQHQASRLAWHLSLGGIKYCVPRTPLIQIQLKASANDFDKNPDANTNPNIAVKTRFTQKQAQWFTANYEIVDHLANTDSGFSATAGQDHTTQNYS